MASIPILPNAERINRKAIVRYAGEERTLETVWDITPGFFGVLKQLTLGRDYHGRLSQSDLEIENRLFQELVGQFHDQCQELADIHQIPLHIQRHMAEGQHATAFLDNLAHHARFVLVNAHEWVLNPNPPYVSYSSNAELYCKLVYGEITKLKRGESDSND